MGLEAATFISQLVATNPVGAVDDYATADDHLRLIKSVLQGQFPNLTAAAVLPTVVELNFVDGVTSAIQTQIDAKAPTAHLHTAGDITTGVFDNARISAGNVTQHVASINHDLLLNFLGAEHIDWAVSGAEEIHADRLADGIASENKFKTASTDKSSDTALADDPHLSGYTLAADQVYEIVGYLSGSEGGGDIKFLMQLSSLAQRAWFTYVIHPQGSTKTPISATDSALNVRSITGLAGASFGLEIHGLVHAHATLSTTMDFQWAQDTSNVANTSLFDTSWLKVVKLGSF